MTTVTMGDSQYRKMKVQRDKLRELLQEWLDAPYFPDYLEWKAWAADYAPRVREVLQEIEENKYII